MLFGSGIDTTIVYDNGAWFTLNSLTGLDFKVITDGVSSSNSTWFCAYNGYGLLKYTNGTWTQYTNLTSANSGNSYYAFATIYQTQDNKIWTGGTNSGSYKLFCFNPNSVGIHTPSYSKGILQLFPNPASNYLRLPENNNCNGEYKVLNQLGQIVQKGILNTTELRLSDFPNGVYQLIISLENSSYTGRFIRNN